MKVQFTSHAGVQPPVSPAQEHMRAARHRRLPVFEALVLIFLVAMVATGVFYYLHTRDVYGYGIVSGPTESVMASVDGTVQNLNVKRGHLVKQGDLLCTILQDVSEKEREAGDKVIDTIVESQSRLREAQANQIEQAQREVDRLAVICQQETVDRDYAINLAKVEVDKLRDFCQDKEQRYTLTKQLFERDATVRSSVETAEKELVLARHNLEQANIDLAFAQARTLSSQPALEKARLELERVKTLPESTQLDLDLVKSELDIASKIKEPIEFRANFDGIVTSVDVANGTKVNQDRMLLSLAAVNNVWIDAYVEVKDAGSLSGGRAARIYVPGVEQALAGSLDVDIRAAARVPETLASIMHSEGVAAYARVIPPEGAVLFPNSIVRVVLERDLSRYEGLRLPHFITRFWKP